MKKASNPVCPVEKAGSLDHRLRRWVQNPRKILQPYLKAGMKVLDAGCGPGFFTLDMARMVGGTGRVIACDLQQGMLEKLNDKIRDTEMERRITLHRCREDRIGVSGAVDFVLAFYLVHELSDQGAFFAEMASILEPHGRILLAEPLFHVGQRAFAETLATAEGAGLLPGAKAKVPFSRAVILRKRRQ